MRHDFKKPRLFKLVKKKHVAFKGIVFKSFIFSVLRLLSAG